MSARSLGSVLDECFGAAPIDNALIVSQGALGASAHNRVVAAVRLTQSVESEPDLIAMAGNNSDLVRSALMEWLPCAVVQAGSFRSYGMSHDAGGWSSVARGSFSSWVGRTFILPSHCLRATAVFAELLLREVSQVAQSKLGPSTVAVAIACSVLNWLPRCSALAKHKPLLERLALEICRCCACH